MYRVKWKVNGIRKDVVEYGDGYFYLHMYAKGTEDVITRVYGPYSNEYDANVDATTIWGEDNPVVEFISAEE